MSNYKLKQLPIYRDIQPILDSDYDNVLYNYKATISTVSKDIEAIRMLSVDIVRDYVNDISEHGYIELQLPVSEYTYNIYPYRDNLEITLVTKKLDPTSGSSLTNESTTTYRYKAIPIDTNPAALNSLDVSRKDDLAIGKSVENYKFQLVDRRIEPLRIMTTSGIYRDTTVGELLYTTIATEANKIRVDGKALLDSLDIVDTDNTKTYSNIIIPAGTLLIDLPDLMQKQIAGVYNAGLSTYLQWYKDMYTWFIYPLYKTDRSNTTEETAIIYSIPKSMLPELDNTYTYIDRTLTIIANQDESYVDSGESDLMQKGVGFRAASAGSFMKKPVIIDDTGVSADRSRLNYETISKGRNDGLNYAPRAAITNNPYTNYSSVLARTVARIDLVWQNADMDLVYPGMPCKYYKTRGSEVIELSGTIVFMQAHTASQTTIGTNLSYRTTLQLTLLTDPYTDDNI